MITEWKALALLLIALFSPVISWLIADARSKTRSAFMEERLGALASRAESSTAAHDTRINDLELNAARSAQDRLDIRRVTDRLDASKASKELVDGFRSEIQSIRADMDKRFDRLERILERREQA